MCSACKVYHIKVIKISLLKLSSKNNFKNVTLIIRSLKK
jgi:hypothetical protein